MKNGSDVSFGISSENGKRPILWPIKVVYLIAFVMLALVFYYLIETYVNIETRHPIGSTVAIEPRYVDGLDAYGVIEQSDSLGLEGTVVVRVTEKVFSAKLTYGTYRYTGENHCSVTLDIWYVGASSPEQYSWTTCPRVGETTAGIPFSTLGVRFELKERK